MIAGTHLYTWVKRDNVEQSFLSKTTFTLEKIFPDSGFITFKGIRILRRLYLRVFVFPTVYTPHKSEEIQCGNGYQALCRFAHPRRKSTTCRPQKGQKGFQDTAETVSWTDDEGEILLGVVRSYSSQKDDEGLEWEEQLKKV